MPSSSRSRSRANDSTDHSASDLFARPVGAPTTEPSGIHDSELSSPLSYGSEALAPVAAAAGPLTHGEEGAVRPLINLSSGEVAPAGSESDMVSSGAAANLVIWGTDVNMERVVAHFTRFLRTFEAPADSEDALRAHLEGELVRYKIPRTFEFVSEPLRDDAGKVRRSKLREERVSAGS